MLNTMKYSIWIHRTKSGKNVIKFYQDSCYNMPIELDPRIILRRALKKAKRKQHKRKTKHTKLDKNNAIEMEIIKNRRRKLLSMMRALG